MLVSILPPAILGRLGCCGCELDGLLAMVGAVRLDLVARKEPKIALIIPLVPLCFDCLYSLLPDVVDQTRLHVESPGVDHYS